jgi:hypothetical protein
VSADLPPEAVEAAAKAEYEAEWTAELERLRGEAEAAERWRQLAAHVATRRDELSAEVKRLRAERQAVLDLHKKAPPEPDWLDRCTGCQELWPCATAAALGAEP